MQDLIKFIHDQAKRSGEKWINAKHLLPTQKSFLIEERLKAEHLVYKKLSQAIKEGKLTINPPSKEQD